MPRNDSSVGEDLAGALGTLMRVSTMRRADRWFGVPACFMLTMARRIFAGTSPAGAATPTRILFVKLAEQGSTVLASTAIRRAIERVGQQNVYFLVFEENRHILDAMALIPERNVITIPAKSLTAAFAGACRAIRRMRRERIDTAIDLEFFARSSVVLAYLSRARWRVGFHAFASEASYRGDLLTHRLSFNPYLHTSHTFEMLVAALDRSPAQLPALDIQPRIEDQALPRFTPRVDEEQEVRRLLREVAGDRAAAPLILLNANASDLLPLRRWPIARYVELARSLLAKYPEVVIAFTGAPDEVAIARQLVREVGSERSISLAGRTTIRQLLAVYGLAEVLVTNDSGPAHFAALTTVDVVTLFGPETPLLFGAPTPRNHTLWAGIACSPCINAFNDRQSPCTNNLCMQSITVDQVFEQVCRIYEARRALAHLAGGVPSMP
jgi:ADP-heptose:LPS heptosyltransferase